MKRPYLTQLQRIAYRCGTLTGDWNMLAYRARVLMRDIARMGVKYEKKLVVDPDGRLMHQYKPFKKKR